MAFVFITSIHVWENKLCSSSSISTLISINKYCILTVKYAAAYYFTFTGVLAAAVNMHLKNIVNIVRCDLQSFSTQMHIMQNISLYY